MYKDCTYKTNVYVNFKSHKHRRHSGASDFKPGIVENKTFNSGSESFRSIPCDISDDEIPCSDEHVDPAIDSDPVNLEKEIELKLALVLLKLENIYLVSNRAIDELLQELSYLIGSVSLPITQKTLTEILQEHSCEFDQSIVEKLANALCESNAIKKALGHKGPLSTAWRRKSYFKRHFNVVEPVEFVLDPKEKKTFQYVSILKSLQQILECQTVLDQARNLNDTDELKQPTEQNGSVHVYKSFYDGAFFKENDFLCQQKSISLILYVDDFEICNPLGTSRRKHKICGIYWVLGNLPPLYHSSLSSIYLAALIKSDDLKSFGYENVLKPLINDLVILEQSGIFVSKLGRTVKGTVQCVVADNLGAHSIAGFVENFTGSYVCRFCTAETVQIQTTEVNGECFCLRTKEIHEEHLRQLQDNGLENYYGVKKQCTLSKHLSYFDVTSGFPPDIVHDLFEGIVPFELSLCLSVFIKKKYFTLLELNAAIRSFDFKGTDKTNKPHPIPLHFGSKKTVGGNAHENWCLIRFVPLLIGQKVPCEEPAWHVLTDLKDIVDLVVSPIHTEESIAYLSFKISEHRIRFQEVFPDFNLKPKHHFLEHYPHLIRQYGPLVALWTMRFEAKHSFFKRVARNIKNFKNVLLSLSEKHQYQTAHHLYTCTFPRHQLEVSDVSAVHIDVLDKGISNGLRDKFLNVDTVHLANNVTHNGLNYKRGMILIHGSVGGLPDFCEIIQMVTMEQRLIFIVKRLSGWYIEHYRAYKLKTSPVKEVDLIEPQELQDIYPLADYRVGGMRLVTLKRYVHL